MSASITSVTLPAIQPIATAGTTTSTSGSFGDVFQDAVQKVEQIRSNATQSVEQFLSGEGEELHSVALAVQKAEMTFELFLQVRNKIVQAYQEIMRMQV